MLYQITPRLTEFLILREGERLVAYRDTNGTWTVGIGHTGPEVVKGYTITLTKSRSLLAADVAAAADVVTRSVRVALTGPQMDALIALCFNIGGPRFLSSTVLRRVNAQDFKKVPDAFRMWNKETIDGQLVASKGLVNRREFEIKLWNMAA